MRNKKAKMLRKQAELETIGSPDIEYNEGQPPAFSVDKLTQKVKKVVLGIPRTLVDDCTRKVYKSKKVN